MNNLAVLIAGTSSSYLEISKKMLKFHYDNCEVDFAHSGKECVDKGLAKAYELILFDYELGDMTGLDVIDAIKAQAPGRNLVMLIEEGDEVKAIQALEKGACDYILKARGYLTALPFTIRSILEKKHLRIPQARTSSPAEERTERRVSEGHFILDRKGRILSANRDIQIITDFSEEELLELAFTDLLPDESEKVFNDCLSAIEANGSEGTPFKAEVVNRHGDRVPLEVVLTPIRDEHKNVLSYRGRVSSEQVAHAVKSVDSRIDQLKMVQQISQTITSSYDETLGVFLEKIVELASQTFGFERATIALLDKRKSAFVKQAMVGYASFPSAEHRLIEVPFDVIDKVFSNRFRVKVIYYNQKQRDPAGSLNSKFPERRTQRRRPPSQWHPRDLVLVNLMNQDDRTFGYISLDKPIPHLAPDRSTFHNLEIFGQFVSFAIENYYQFSSIEKRSRRLKQMLVTSNIFKLHLSLNDLLKEVVWSVRFSLNFNLVALGLISKRSGDLEMKAIACDDKVKRTQLSELKFPIKPLSGLLRTEYHCGRSYLVAREEELLKTFKHIYYGPKLDDNVNGHWPMWGLLLVPIKSREGKIIGMLMADDPGDNRVPGKDVISLLEIMANQVAIAVDNRILYVQAARHTNDSGTNGISKRDIFPERKTHTTRHRFVDRFFK